MPRKGGVLTISYAAKPRTLDPSASCREDTNAILKLTSRSLPTSALRDGKSFPYFASRADSEITRITQLKNEEQSDGWAKFDREIRSHLLPTPPTTYPRASYLFGTKVRNVVPDVNTGLPDLSGIWVDH